MAELFISLKNSKLQEDIYQIIAYQKTCLYEFVHVCTYPFMHTHKYKYYIENSLKTSPSISKDYLFV